MLRKAAIASDTVRGRLQDLARHFAPESPRQQRRSGAIAMLCLLRARRSRSSVRAEEQRGRYPVVSERGRGSIDCGCMVGSVCEVRLFDEVAEVRVGGL